MRCQALYPEPRVQALKVHGQLLCPSLWARAVMFVTQGPGGEPPLLRREGLTCIGFLVLFSRPPLLLPLQGIKRRILRCGRWTLISVSKQLGYLQPAA